MKKLELNRKERFLVFLQMEDAPLWKQNLSIFMSICAIIAVICMGSLLIGLCQGTPSGNNIPLM